MPDRTLILDFDGVIADTMDEDMLCVYSILRETPYLEDMGEVRPRDFRDSEAASQERLRMLWKVRPDIRLVEDYLAYLRAWHQGLEVDRVRPSKILSRDDIQWFRQEFYRVRQGFKEIDYPSWMGLHRIYDGIVGVVDRAGAEGIPFTIATARGRESTVEILRHAGLLSRVAAMRTREDAGDKGAMVSSILDEIGVSSGVFVDDSLKNLLDVGPGAGILMSGWGYVSDHERAAALDSGIPVISHPVEILGHLGIRDGRS